MNEKIEDEQENTDIDYLHPEGKPVKKVDPKEETKFDGRELEAASRREKSTMIDVDGHHICSAECQKHHKVKLD
ncbi:MAG TPA: hypothetical protein V6C81_18855 [Planktothrix sp.]|jgi:hypothetical protein